MQKYRLEINRLPHKCSVFVGLTCLAVVLKGMVLVLLESGWAEVLGPVSELLFWKCFGSQRDLWGLREVAFVGGWVYRGPVH